MTKITDGQHTQGNSETAQSAASKVKQAAFFVTLLVLLLANLAFTIGRAVDAVHSNAGQSPDFSLWLTPTWLEPESRTLLEKAVLMFIPVLSTFLPVLLLFAVLFYLIGRCRAGKSLLPSWGLIVAVVGMLLINAVTAFLISTAVPSFGEGEMFDGSGGGMELGPPGMGPSGSGPSE